MISVIICSHNRQSLLEEILEVLSQQTVDLNVYVIDDSTNFLVPTFPVVKKVIYNRFDGLYHRVAKYNEGLSVAPLPVVLLDDDTIPQSKLWAIAYEQALLDAQVVRGAFLYEGKLNRIPWFSTTNIGASIPIKFDPVYDGRYGYEDHGMGQELKARGATIIDGPAETACIHKGEPFSGDRIATKINEAYYNKKWGLA